MLGITVRTVDAQLARALGLPVTLRGALITRVARGSPAARYGLPLGGVITSINGAATVTADDVITLIRQADLRRPIEIRYWDRGRFARKRVVLVPEPAPALPPSVLELESQLESTPKPSEDTASGGTSPSLVELLKHVERLERRVEELEARLKRLESSPEKAPSNKKAPSSKEGSADQDEGGSAGESNSK